MEEVETAPEEDGGVSAPAVPYYNTKTEFFEKVVEQQCGDTEIWVERFRCWPGGLRQGMWSVPVGGRLLARFARGKGLVWLNAQGNCVSYDRTDARDLGVDRDGILFARKALMLEGA